MMSSHSQYPEIATWSDGASVVVDSSATAETRFLHDAIRALRRHKILFTTTFIAVVIIGLAVAIVLPASYEASSTVLIDPSHREAVDMKAVLADIPVDPEAIASEIEILNSRELLELVSQKLNLQTDPEFNPNPPETRSGLEPKLEVGFAICRSVSATGMLVMMSALAGPEHSARNKIPTANFRKVE